MSSKPTIKTSTLLLHSEAVASMSDIELEQLLKRQEEQEEMLSELRSRSFKIDETDRTELSENAIYDLHQRDDELFLSLDVPGVMEESLHVELKDTELLIRGEHPTFRVRNDAEST